MNPISSFGTYQISQRGKQRLESLKQLIQHDSLEHENNQLWISVIGKSSNNEEETETDSEFSENDEQQIEEKESLTQFSSTQYFFTQSDRVEPKQVTDYASLQICDIVESLLEGLQRANGKFNTDYLKNLPDDKVEHVAQKLKNRLCPKGFYNLCHSILNMNVEDRMIYMNVICSQILLPMMTNTVEPPRLMCSAIGECAQKFPDDIEKYIFLPILNIELKDVTLWNTIINTYNPHRKSLLLSQFLEVVKELRVWHILILQSLLCTQTDENTNDKLIELFLQKASFFSKEKNFGKLILCFLKLNKDLTESQADLLWEVVVDNETIFKTAIQNILKPMCSSYI